MKVLTKVTGVPTFWLTSAQLFLSEDIKLIRIFRSYAGTTRAPAYHKLEIVGTPVTLFTVKIWLRGCRPRNKPHLRKQNVWSSCRPWVRTYPEDFVEIWELDWNLQLFTWTSQMPSGEKGFWTMRLRLIILTSLSVSTVCLEKPMWGFQNEEHCTNRKAWWQKHYVVVLVHYTEWMEESKRKYTTKFFNFTSNQWLDD